MAADREAEAVARVRRLRQDFAYWARTCYRIRDKDLRIVPMRLNAVQEKIEAAEQDELARRGRAFLYVLKGRQPGVTTYEQGKSLHEVWRRPHVDVLTLAHSKEDTGKIFGITRRAIANFPPALLPKMGGADTFEVSFTERDSRFWTGTAGSKGPGRGLTLVRVHGSEFAFWSDPRGTLGALSPGLEGVPGAVIVLETTASGSGSEAHQFWEQTVKGETGYRPIFFPWWECDPPRYRRPLEDPDELGDLTGIERDLVDRQGLDLEQIAWRRDKIRYYGLARFLREYPEDDIGCWMVSGTPFYNSDTLLALKQRATAPTRYVPRSGGEERAFSDRPEGDRDGEVWCYEEPDAGEEMVGGVDTAEGGGGDRSAYVIRGKSSGRLIEEYTSRSIESAPFAELLDRRGRARSVFWVVEKNMHGITVLRKLRDAGYPRELIYRRQVLDDRNPEEKTSRLGWVTSAGTVGLVLDAGRDLLAAAIDGTVSAPSADAVRDFFSVQVVADVAAGASLKGRDIAVSECLAWIGRTAPRRRGGGGVF